MDASFYAHYFKQSKKIREAEAEKTSPVTNEEPDPSPTTSIISKRPRSPRLSFQEQIALNTLKKLTNNNNNTELSEPGEAQDIDLDRISMGQETIKLSKHTIHDNEKSASLINILDSSKGSNFLSIPPNNISTTAPSRCILPTSCAHVYRGHNRAVTSLDIHPQYGHVFISSSMDGQLKIWDIYKTRQCLATITGHNLEIHFCCYDSTGDHFVTLSADKTLKYWNSDTLKVIHSFEKENSTPYHCLFHKNSVDLLVAYHNGKIVQYDLRTYSPVFTYEGHKACVKRLSWLESQSKFVSSSTDGSIRIWEFNRAKTFKYLPDPSRFYCCDIKEHPSSQFWVGQSVGSSIRIFSSKSGGYKLNRKTAFTGHYVAGYPVEFAFSPDGQYLASGDATGKVFFWDTKSREKQKILYAHGLEQCSWNLKNDKIYKLCNVVKWHPFSPSNIITGGWDGLIKLWK